MYACCTGEAPFSAATLVDTLVQVKDPLREPQRPSQKNAKVPRDLETICLKCLEKEPTRRYGSAEALADDLERWLSGEPIRARRAGAVERTLKWAKRQPALAALALLGVGSLAAVIGLAAWGWQEAEHGRIAAEEKVADLLAKKKGSYFLQIVKEPMPELASGTPQAPRPSEPPSRRGRVRATGPTPRVGEGPSRSGVTDG